MKKEGMRLGALSGWGAAAVAILVWGVTFANTRVLLGDFSALEINILRFGLAWLCFGAARRLVSAAGGGLRLSRFARL
jgi:hypothetical protein